MWSPNERVNLRRNGSNHGVTAEQLTLPAGMPDGEWRKRQFDSLFIGFSGASLASHISGPVMNHFDGEILTVRWNNRGTPMLTKRGLAVRGRTGTWSRSPCPSPSNRSSHLLPDRPGSILSSRPRSPPRGREVAEGGEIEEPEELGPQAPSVLDQEPGQVDMVPRSNVWDIGESPDETIAEAGGETADVELASGTATPVESDPGAMTVISLPSSPVAPKQVEGASEEDRALLAETERWLQQAINLLAREGRHKVADELRGQLSRQPKSRPSVIVAGEDKRGKSSLVNALMRYPGLSPTGVEVVTAAPIVLHRSAKEEAFVYHYGDTTKFPVSFEEAQSLATVTGNPLNEQNIRSVHLGVDRPILDRFILVDTPGVGGLESGHAALTLQSLRDADALLFVLEAGAQIRAQELAFLQTAASRINRVVFAFTKVDLHRGWQTVMATNRQILSERAPRLAACPMIAVSSQLALKALSLEGEDAQGAEDRVRHRRARKDSR
jgi:predicted GTPase